MVEERFSGSLHSASVASSLGVGREDSGEGRSNRRNRAESEYPKPLKRRGGEIAVIAVIASDRSDRGKNLAAQPRAAVPHDCGQASGTNGDCLCRPGLKQQLPKLGKQSK